MKNVSHEDLLFSRVVDGDASPEDWHELEVQAQSDPDVWQRLAAAVRTESLLEGSRGDPGQDRTGGAPEGDTDLDWGRLGLDRPPRRCLVGLGRGRSSSRAYALDEFHPSLATLAGPHRDR